MRQIVILFLSLCICGSSLADSITVSAAISLKESLNEIAKIYGSNTGDQIKFNFDASGKLAAQIRQGAPVDLFISADQEQMDKLAAAGKVDAATRRVVVDNELVLIVNISETDPPKNFADLANHSSTKIAIGEPRTVPAGHYAMQTLQALHLDKALVDRLVMGESVRQVLAYVEQKQVWAGLVYRTDAQQAKDQVKVVATAEPQAHDPIEYPAAVIQGATHAGAARQFQDFLGSDAAHRIFLAHGFKLPNTATSKPVP